jgi:hypothetical protein
MHEDVFQATPAVKPSFRYAVSSKFVAAHGRNLEKAFIVPKEVRYPLTTNPDTTAGARFHPEKKQPLTKFTERSR